MTLRATVWIMGLAGLLLCSRAPQVCAQSSHLFSIVVLDQRGANLDDDIFIVVHRAPQDSLVLPTARGFCALRLDPSPDSLVVHVRHQHIRDSYGSRTYFPVQQTFYSPYENLSLRISTHILPAQTPHKSRHREAQFPLPEHPPVIRE